MGYLTFCDEAFKKTKHYIINRNDAKLFFVLTEYRTHYVAGNPEKTVLAFLDAVGMGKGISRYQSVPDDR